MGHILSVYHFVHTILFVPFCLLPFCPVSLLCLTWLYFILLYLFLFTLPYMLLLYFNALPNLFHSNLLCLTFLPCLAWNIRYLPCLTLPYPYPVLLVNAWINLPYTTFLYITYLLIGVNTGWVGGVRTTPRFWDGQGSWSLDEILL